MRRANCMLGKLVGAASLALALALTGCEQASSENTASTEEVVEAETDNICIDEEVGLSSDLVRSALASAGSAESADLSELPESDEEGLAIETGDTVGESAGEQSKAAADTMLVTCGGMEVRLPSTWQSGGGDDSMQVFLNEDFSVIAVLSALAKDGQPCDVASVAAGIPAAMSEKGYENIQIVQHGDRCSDSGEYVSSFVLVTYERDGYTHVEYYEFMESKSYVNSLYVVTNLADWEANHDDISTIVDSVAFALGEAI